MLNMFQIFYSSSVHDQVLVKKTLFKKENLIYLACKRSSIFFQLIFGQFKKLKVKQFSKPILRHMYFGFHYGCLLLLLNNIYGTKALLEKKTTLLNCNYKFVRFCLNFLIHLQSEKKCNRQRQQLQLITYEFPYF